MLYLQQWARARYSKLLEMVKEASGSARWTEHSWQVKHEHLRSMRGANVVCPMESLRMKV
jgi:hypothetical protein